jgi:hypothetical protein
MLLGRRRVRRARAALLAGRGLARALARRAALLVLRLGSLGHLPSVIQGNRVADAAGRRDDGQHCCGDEKRRSCHAIGPPDGSMHAGSMIRRVRATKSALDACSNANNTTKLRQQAVPRPAWPIDLRL